MSEEQLKAFLAKVLQDSSLQERLKACVDTDAVVLLAKEAGFMFSSDDLKLARASKIPDAELENLMQACSLAGPLCNVLNDTCGMTLCTASFWPGELED
jgi:predicted ribosomally synthesized peptide with nif11-like leader